MNRELAQPSDCVYPGFSPEASPEADLDVISTGDARLHCVGLASHSEYRDRMFLLLMQFNGVSVSEHLGVFFVEHNSGFV